MTQGGAGEFTVLAQITWKLCSRISARWCDRHNNSRRSSRARWIVRPRATRCCDASLPRFPNRPTAHGDRHSTPSPKAIPLVTENVFESRFMFVNEPLARLRCPRQLLTGQHASITGVTSSYLAPLLKPTDIRAGAGLDPCRPRLSEG